MAKRHVEQRIQERAVPAEAHRAFALLRDPAALSAFIDRSLTEDVADAEEIGLPLAAKTPSSRLIVNRKGQGVTCLSADMATPAPTLVWAAVERFLDEADRQLKAQMALSRDAGKADNQKPLLRALRYGYRLTRPELDALVPLVPLVGNGLFDLCQAHVERLTELRPRARKWPVRTDREVDALWREHTAAAVQLMLLGEHPGFTQLAFAALATGDAQISIRALWMLANRPVRTLDALDDVIADASKPAVHGLVTLLALLALRFPELRGRAENTRGRAMDRFGNLPPLPPGNARQATTAIVFVSALSLLLWRHPDRALRDDASIAAYKATVQRVQHEALLDGLSLQDMAERVGGWSHRVVGLLDPHRHLDQRQTWRPWAGPADDQQERVRLILWRSVMRDLRVAPLGLPAEILCVLTAAPLDALLPPARPDPLWRVRAGREYVRELLPALLAG